MASVDQTKIKPDAHSGPQDNNPSTPTYQRPSPLNGVALPRALKGSRNAEKHGFHTFKRTVLKLGRRAIDGRSGVAKALKHWRNELTADLGGWDSVSTAQACIIDLAVKQKFLLDSIDAWLLQQDTLISGRKKSLLPVVKERQAVANALAEYLKMLGLERRLKVKTLHEILSQPDSQEQEGDSAGIQQ
jgi:hypothetical protein